MRPTELCFVDLETTGLDPARHAIVEVGMAKIEMDGFETLATFERIASTHTSSAVGFAAPGGASYGHLMATFATPVGRLRRGQERFNRV